MDNNDRIKMDSWKDKGLDNFGQRIVPSTPKPADFISGANFDALLDELMFNRMIRLKNLTEKPQGNDPGKVYWDKDTKSFKVWVDETGGWANVVYTTTSTSTSSTSSSSSTSISTSSTSSSTSTSTTP